MGPGCDREMGINLIMPMGGSGSRFSGMGFDLPKPLIPIHGRPFLFWSAESVRKFIGLQSLTFVVLQDHIERFKIDTAIRQFYPDAIIHVLDKVLNGAVLTCLRGVTAIDNDRPVLFNDCDHIFTCREFVAFCSQQENGSIKGNKNGKNNTVANGNIDRNIDGALLTFESSEPKFSFVMLDETGYAVKTAEKKVISNNAICGAYYFRDRWTFELAAKEYLNEPVHSEYYMSGVYNTMIRQKAAIRTFKVDMHLPFGTPGEYDSAIKSDAFEVFV